MTTQMISVNQLAQETGMSVSHLTQLRRRGILPEGEKQGKTRMLPYAESKLILMCHMPGKHWPKQNTKKQQDTPKSIDWGKLL